MGDLIGNKIADKIANISKKPVKELSNNNHDEKEEEDVEITTQKKKKMYIARKRQQIIDELRLVPKNYLCFAIYKNGISKFVRQCIKPTV